MGGDVSSEWWGEPLSTNFMGLYLTTTSGFSLWTFNIILSALLYLKKWQADSVKTVALDWVLSRVFNVSGSK